MNNPLISVCITTYNMEKYIARALDSVLMQKLNVPMEIIISDDHSTDGTLSIVEYYLQKYAQVIHILYANENKGLITNFVKAFKHTRGKYIAYLDADDYWIDPFKLQKQYDILEKNSDIGYVYTNLYFERGKMRTAGVPDGHEAPKDDPFIDTLMNQWQVIITACFRKEAIDFKELDVFVEKKFHAQDLPLFLHLSLHSKAYYLKDFTTVCSVIEGSMSRNPDVKKRIEVFYKCQQIGDYFIEKHPIPEEVSNKRNFNFKLKVLSATWQSGDFKLVSSFSKDLSLKDFIKHKPLKFYLYYGSKNKILYHLLKLWVLRKRRNSLN